MPTFSGLDIVWNLLIFLLVLSLLIVTLFFLKKLNPSLGKREGKNIKFVESYDLGTRQKIILLEVNGERFLIGVGPSQISLLSKIEKKTIETADLNRFSD
tara:strand:- start:184 stop:483 length:300 start_codon:yes stop_codon:yes gene_type:complete